MWLISFTHTHMRAIVKIIFIHSIRSFFECTVQSEIRNGPLYHISCQTSFLGGAVRVLGSGGVGGVRVRAWN